MKEWMKLSALELSEKIRQRELGVREVVEGYLEQIEKKDVRLHAFLTIEKDNLMQEIQRVQSGIESGRYQGPLAGIPVAVKDNICTKGIRTTCASKMLERFVPPYDAEAVIRLKEAGMLVLGKTNMDEFAMGSTTETSYFGITRNPYRNDCVPGGSSGGSCAAVAAGEAPLALGSDTGGSIRQPAAYCGVVGLKPTYGRVSRSGLIAYASSLDQIGPIGKNVRDCAACYEVLAGKDKKDSTSSQQPVESVRELWGEEALNKTAACYLQGKKIGVPREYLAEGIEAEVKEAIEETMKQLQTSGCEVELFSLDYTEYVIPAYYLIACAEASSNLERFDGVKYGYRNETAEGLHEMYKKSRQEGFGEEVKHRILLGAFVLSEGYYDAYYLKALKAKAFIFREFERVFQKYDCILAPAAPTTAPELGTSLTDPLKMYLSDIYTVAVNLAGLPAISLPIGMDRKGLPIGMQIIGNRFQEKNILGVAAGVEQLRGGEMYGKTI